MNSLMQKTIGQKWKIFLKQKWFFYIYVRVCFCFMSRIVCKCYWFNQSCTCVFLIWPKWLYMLETFPIILILNEIYQFNFANLISILMKHCFSIAASVIKRINRHCLDIYYWLIFDCLLIISNQSKCYFEGSSSK